MASFFTLITATGQAKIAAAIAAGTAVSLTHMAVGDGNGNPITPAESMTALVRERYRAAVTNLRQHETNSNWLVAELVIPATVGGWTVHEVGLFDTDGALIAIGSFPATYKPVLAEGSTRELVARIILEVSDTAAITLIVDPTIVMASRQWVADNFSVGKQLPGGTTGQFLRKKSDASGDVEWSNSFGQATTEAAGVVELATDAEAIAGTDTERAVTPAALAAALGSFAAPSALPRCDIITATGTWTAPEGVTEILAEIWGGGGGGGAAITNSGSSGGGGGGYARKRITVTPGGAYAVTIGAGGAGSAASATPGGAGGTSSFGAHASATGGGGGISYAGVSTPGGAAGSGVGGDVNISGEPGGYATDASTLDLIGRGGASHCHPGGQIRATNGYTSSAYPGVSATSPGCGGSGSGDPASAGGNGFRGQVLVWY